MQDGPRTLTEIDLQATSPVKTTQFGALGQTEDGRLFRYVQAGASPLAAGAVALAAAITANSTNLTIPAQAASNLLAGSRTLIITNGATAVTQDQFAEGFIEVLGTGGGYSVRISGNTAAAGAGAITVTLAEALPSAVVAGTNTVTIAASEFAGLVTSTTAALPIGVVRTALPALNYGWVQSYGHCLVAATGAITKGAGIAQDTVTTAGNAATASGVLYQIGVAKETAANGFVVARIALD